MEVSGSKPSAPLKSTLLADVLLAPPHREDVNTELSTDMDDIPAHVKETALDWLPFVKSSSVSGICFGRESDLTTGIDTDG